MPPLWGTLEGLATASASHRLLLGRDPRGVQLASARPTARSGTSFHSRWELRAPGAAALASRVHHTISVPLDAVPELLEVPGHAFDCVPRPSLGDQLRPSR